MSPFLLVSIALFLVWSALFFLSTATRREQAIMSIVGLLLSPGALFFASADFRSGGESASAFGVENFIFSFALFGVAAVVYQAAFGKRVAAWRGDRYRIAHPGLHWASHLAILLGIWVFVALVTSLVFHLTMIQSVTVGGLLIGIYVIADRQDLLLDALLSGIFSAILVFVMEQLFFARLFPEAALSFWNIDNLSGIVLGGIPVEEILWAAVVGFAVGPLYEYIRRYRLV